jgi:hypothetical protein
MIFKFFKKFLKKEEKELTGDKYVLHAVEQYFKNNPNPPKIELTKGLRRWDAPIPPRPPAPKAPPKINHCCKRKCNE